MLGMSKNYVSVESIIKHSWKLLNEYRSQIDDALYYGQLSSIYSWYGEEKLDFHFNKFLMLRKYNEFK